MLEPACFAWRGVHPLTTRHPESGKLLLYQHTTRECEAGDVALYPEHTF